MADGLRGARWVRRSGRSPWKGGAAGLGTVDAVARVSLMARRQGWRMVLHPGSGELRALLELAGLGVEVQGQAEHGEEPLGVQEEEEEGHLGDPAT